jgi:hypothetical protein
MILAGPKNRITSLPLSTTKDSLEKDTPESRLVPSPQLLETKLGLNITIKPGGNIEGRTKNNVFRVDFTNGFAYFNFPLSFILIPKISYFSNSKNKNL